MQSKYVKTILNLLLYVIGILLLCLLLPRFLRFFMPFVIGWIISLIANPLVRFFEKKLKIVRKHGSWVVIVGVLALLITGGYFAAVWLIKEGISFVKYLPDAYSAMVDGFHAIGSNLSGIQARLPLGFQEGMTEFFADIETTMGEIAGTIGGSTLSAAGDLAKEIPNLLIMLIFMLMSAYFFVADREKISGRMREILPQSFMDRISWVKRMFSHAVGGYFKAQFKIMGVIAVILWIGFLILKVEYAPLWAIFISLLDFLPFLGTGTAIWPWAAFQLLTGDYSMAVGLMIIYLVCLLVHQLLQPKFVGDTVGMDSLTTLIFMFIGYRFSNVFGMILAVPIGIIVINLYKAGAFEKIIGDVGSLVEDFNNYRNS